RAGAQHAALPGDDDRAGRVRGADARRDRRCALGGPPGNHDGYGERSGGCERRARSSLLRRAFRHASSVVAALAALAPRLVRLAHHDYPEGLLVARGVRVGTVTVGGGAPLALIAGPCVIESRDAALRHAERVRDIAARAGLPVVYKSSFDKANRTWLDGFRGVGMEEGLAILAEVRRATG